MDLLTVVSHELGHVLGLDHDDSAGLMAPMLGPGTSHVRSKQLDLESLLSNTSAIGFGAEADGWDAVGVLNGLSQTRFLVPRDSRMPSLGDTESVAARDRFFDSFSSESDRGFRLERPARAGEPRYGLRRFSRVLRTAVDDDHRSEVAEVLGDEQFVRNLVRVR
jgi:hypothetical protein